METAALDGGDVTTDVFLIFLLAISSSSIKFLPNLREMFMIVILSFVFHDQPVMPQNRDRRITVVAPCLEL